MKKDKFFTTILGASNDDKVLVEIKREVCAAFQAWTEHRFDYFYAKQEYQRHTIKKVKKIFKQDTKTIKEVRRFYDACIVDFEFDDRTNFASNQKQMQPKELYKNIISNDMQDVYLVGSVGCGKSTYITALLEEFHKNKHVDNTFVLSIDFTNITIKDDHEKSIVTILRDKVNAYLKPNSKINVDNLKDFWAKLESTFPNNRTVFIFDNIDQVYDESIKLIFFKLLTEEERSTYLNNKLFLTQSLRILKTSIREHCNKKTNFLYAMRPNTYKNINPRTHDRHINNRNSVVFISAKNLGFITKVIDKRLGALAKINNGIVALDSVRKNLHQIAKHATDYNLHGLRHVINNIQVFLSKDTTEEFPAWMNSMFLFLDNRKTYTQNRTRGNTGVANIFLVNAQWRVDKECMPDSVVKDHRQSYWLKYFIVCSIYDINNLGVEKDGGNFNDNDIYRHQFYKYEEHIYKLCIYSLSEVVHGRLIACDYLTDDYCLYDTWRLKKCIEDNVFFSFTYLASIVDDSYMEYPICIKDKITRKQLYQSFFPSKKEYKWWVQWLNKSVLKVFMFLQTIESSLEYYEVNYLDKRLYDKYKPNFEKIRKNINADILKIGVDLGLAQKEIETTIRKSMSQVADEKEKLDMFFLGYEKHVSQEKERQGHPSN